VAARRASPDAHGVLRGDSLGLRLPARPGARGTFAAPAEVIALS
jgi:hypothetical protein